MIFKCKVKPSNRTCLACMTASMNYDLPCDCEKCEESNKDYIIMQLGTGKNGDYAFITVDGKIRRVGLNRIEQVRCIKEEEL